ncbi:MAG: flagellar hook-length control protein FliK [Sulfurimonas sp.]|nr:flagellar hook-length control protein FliK [Sulfurimonas sp.]
MISLDMKSETKTSSSSPLSLSTPSDKPTLSFSELLKGVSDKKNDKVIQNGSLILSLDTKERVVKDSNSISKSDSLLSLLKNEERLVPKSLEEPLELNPKITSTLTTKEMKVLISEAKDYLKGKIENSDDFKKSQIKELPKTLKGLVEVAKTFGIDISKISLEEVKAHAQVKPQADIVKNAEIKTNSTLELREVAQDKKVPASEVKEAALDKKVVAPEVKEAAQDKKVTAPEVKEVAQDKKFAAPEIKEVAQDKKVAVSEPKEIKAQTQQVADKIKTAPAFQPEQLKEIKNDEKFIQVQKEVKATPLFKAHTAVEHTTTEQIVQVKASNTLKVEQKTPKDKADETLKLLLRGEKPSMSNPSLTADFSVATAKVIATTAASDAAKSLETLLHGDSSSESGVSSTKAEALTTHKADSFEVKLNEAKQMIKYLSNDVKTAIEDYKSPFTRIKVQLNPQKLGEVDLTIVQRGKNLHVNISSNNTAVNTLAMNANELRVQLNNSGINNATLNFSDNAQNNQNTQQQQQQSRQNERQANEEYSYFDKEETNEEVLSSLEIVVPQYG